MSQIPLQSESKMLQGNEQPSVSWQETAQYPFLSHSSSVRATTAHYEVVKSQKIKRSLNTNPEDSPVLIILRLLAVMVSTVRL